MESWERNIDDAKTSMGILLHDLLENAFEESNTVDPQRVRFYFSRTLLADMQRIWEIGVVCIPA